jgi:chorismate--pyruvate lyase
MRSNTDGSGRMLAMIPGKARPLEPVQWLPAERLGQLSVDSHLRPWLIGKGLLTLRLKAACQGRFALKLLDQWSGVLSAAHRLTLRVTDEAALFRDVEMHCGDHVWVFAQTVMPDSTLCAHPWLAELGDSSLGETLSDLSGFERTSYEYAWLPAADTLSARALRDAQVKPAGLWGRRSRILLRGAPLLVQELFLPALGRV